MTNTHENGVTLIKDDIFKLFIECFYTFVHKEEKVREIISDTENHIICYYDKCQMTGVSIINKNVIYLLCVNKNYRGKGYGKKLLQESEKYIQSQGYDEVFIGAGEDYIFPGVPMNEGMHIFFQKYGYIHYWEDSECFDMCLDLNNFKCEQYDVNDTINGITYRFANENDLTKIIEAVDKGEKDFINYYTNPVLYVEHTKQPVLIAEVNDEVIGAIMLDLGTVISDEGNVGCTVTVPNYRNRGVASTLIQIATRQLKKYGLKRATLEYTYTDIINIYSRVGYGICMKYFMAKKLLNFNH